MGDQIMKHPLNGTLSTKNKSPFRIKNGKRFQNVLTKAAQGDNNIGKMFVDNLDGIVDINSRIESGEFKWALLGAFRWERSNEGHDFWSEIYGNIKDKRNAK